MYIRIKDVGGEQICKALNKATGLYDCYNDPPVVEGIPVSHEYLERQLWLAGGALLELSDSIVGGIYGDVASQILRVLEGNGLIDDSSPVELREREMTYGEMKQSSAQRFSDMVSPDAVDDKDQECFRSKRHILDTFWEGCIEQNNDWNNEDD